MVSKYKFHKKGETPELEEGEIAVPLSDDALAIMTAIDELADKIMRAS